MEQHNSYFIDMFGQRSDLLALTVVENPYPYNPLIDGLDLLVLLIATGEAAKESTEHIQYNGERALIRTIHEAHLQRWIASGENRNIIEWLVRGEIVLDRDGYLADIRERLLSFPESMREQKQLVEFIGFLRTYLHAKQDLLDGHLLDAYGHVLTALQHWAHIVLVEEGKHPELTVWKQIKRIHPGVYKLFEELTASPETLEQRVQLVMLACEFSVMNKMKSCCNMLFKIMQGKEEPWSIAELQACPDIERLGVDLTLVIHKLVKRSYLKEVAVMHDNSASGELELRYVVVQ
ncbi:nucleotidyltransferase-like protein [Paenibacillus sp. J5C_2022]|uniref:nucleotidyltransferase-like protein n=1 Tax=Paenibacillus sp. J5C2022 TaxID=2977129 RepID=UPI0021D3E3BB|nr:nucleotidyltransferase-like protein [Paenibacillus sp. J5C2022]MCU6712667.1 nucleotidyltransferase-like protein [Paenibacillus sp. J5C2022]